MPADLEMVVEVSRKMVGYMKVGHGDLEVKGLAL
jgi:hypothetical protein